MLLGRVRLHQEATCAFVTAVHCDAASLMQDLSVGRLDCTPDPIFTPTTYTLQDVEDLMPAQVLEQARLVAQQLPPGLLAPLEGLEIVMKPVALHAMVLAVFASLVAPFGELGVLALWVPWKLPFAVLSGVWPNCTSSLTRLPL